MTDTPHSFASMPSVDDFEEQRLLAELQASMFGTRDPVKLGRYSIGRRLGSGAMGVVYEAEDPRLRRRVALKVLHPDLRSAHASRGHQRLRREAQSLSQVNHPNVIDVYDVGESKGRVYLAMELVDGVSLDAWLSEGRRGASEILAVFAQAGKGLAAAHEAGVIHRDFKPSNVIIDRHGRVKVLDFGLAKAEASGQSTADADAPERVSSHVTRDDSLVGTPRYMAPELLLRKPATERSDQYGFCVALFESLFDRAPFDEAAMLTSKLASDGISAPQKQGVPRRVQRALQRGLSADPSRRFASMHALLARLDPHSGALWPRAGGMLLLAGAVAVAFMPSTEPSPGHRIDVDEPDIELSEAYEDELVRARDFVAAGDTDAAEQILRDVLARVRGTQDRDTSSRAMVLLGKLLYEQGRDDEALDALEQGHLDAVVGRAHDERAEAAAQIAFILLKSGRTASAQRWLRDSRSTIESEGVRVGTELTGLLLEVEYARQTGRREAAAEFAAEAAALAQEVGDARLEDAALVHAVSLFELQRFDEAGPIVRELLARSGAKGIETTTTAEAVMVLAGIESVRARTGDKSAVESSIALARRGAKLFASLPGIKPLARVRAELNLSNVLGSAGEHLAAVDILRGALLRVRSSDALMVQSGILLADLESALGYELVMLETYGDAELHLHRAVLIFQEVAGAKHPRQHSTLVMLARAQTRRGKHELANLTIGQALAGPGLTDIELTSSLWEGAEISAAAGRADEAAERFEASAEAFERVGDPEGARTVRKQAAETLERTAANPSTG